MAHQYLQQQEIFQTSAFRLRTKRRRRRALIADRDKQLLAVSRERDRLWQFRRDLPWVPLLLPVVRGWKRTFVLRDDVSRHKNAPMYERILERINTVQYSHRRDFKKKRRSRGRKIHVATNQHLSRLEPWNWRRCGFSPEEAAQFDLVAEAPEKQHEPPRYWYVFREPWRYVLRIQPNVITKVRQYDEGLEAAIKAVDSFLNDRKRWGRLDKLLRGAGYGGWKYNDQDFSLYTRRRPFRNIPLHTLLIT